jgi:hypothetical protein
MLTATPKSFFSSSYTVRRGSTTIGTLNFTFFSEKGTLTHNNIAYEINKPSSGRWTLDDSAHTYARAYKPSLFSREIEIQTAGGNFTLKPKSFSPRTFILHAGSRTLGAIQPVGFLSNTATIDLPSLTERDQMFTFWLVALLWRRAAAAAAS